MTTYAIELSALMAIFFFVIVSPGADLAMVMRQSIVHGRRSAVVTSFGIGVSLLFHIGYTILGLGLIISQSILLFNIVKWCGVAYLVYIGIQSLRAGTTTIAELRSQSRPSWYRITTQASVAQIRKPCSRPASARDLRQLLKSRLENWLNSMQHKPLNFCARRRAIG